MTVCVAALAQTDKIIVCVADKALSVDTEFGGSLSWDSDATKIIPLSDGRSVAMTAGNDTYVTRLMRKIRLFDGFDGPLSVTIQFLEDKFSECLTEIQDIEILQAHGISRPQYQAAFLRTKQSVAIDRISHHMREKAQSLDLEIMVCGFDDRKSPYILTVGAPGWVKEHTANGFYAIGAGSPQALARLLVTDYKKTNLVAHTLFDCFDAKVTAELSPFVGYEWDGYLLYDDRGSPLAKSAEKLLNEAWAFRNRSPFKTAKEPGDHDDPPADWQEQIVRIVAESGGFPYSAGRADITN